MKVTISEIVPKRLNVSYVAFSFDPPPSGLGRKLAYMTARNSQHPNVFVTTLTVLELLIGAFQFGAPAGALHGPTTTLVCSPISTSPRGGR
jgi:hypothetical protein